MKDHGMNSIKIVDIKKNSSKLIGLLIQALLVEFTLLFGIISIFENLFMVCFYMTIGLTLLVMAYNNTKIYHKKNKNLIYILFGLIMIFSALKDYWSLYG